MHKVELNKKKTLILSFMLSTLPTKVQADRAAEPLNKCFHAIAVKILSRPVVAFSMKSLEIFQPFIK